MSTSHSSQTTPAEENSWTLLLEPFYGDYYTPVYWEPGKKNKNYFALISKGTKYPFTRKFLRNLTLDNEIVFRISDFPEEAIIEQKAVFVKGSKEEVVFHGFFIIHLTEEGIKGEEISQKEALQYFDIQDRLPDIEHQDEALNQLRVKLGTVIRKFTLKYGEDAIVQILTSILEEYFPKC